MMQKNLETPLVVVKKNDRYAVCDPQYGISIICSNLDDGYRQVIEKRNEILSQMTELGLEKYIDPTPLNINPQFNPRWKKILIYATCLILIILPLTWVKNSIIAFKKNIMTFENKINATLYSPYELNGKDNLNDRARKLGIFIAPYYNEIRKLVTDEEYLNQSIKAHNAKLEKSKNKLRN